MNHPQSSSSSLSSCNKLVTKLTFQYRPHRDASLVYYKQLRHHCCIKTIIISISTFFFMIYWTPPIHWQPCISGLVTHKHLPDPDQLAHAPVLLLQLISTPVVLVPLGHLLPEYQKHQSVWGSPLQCRLMNFISFPAPALLVQADIVDRSRVVSVVRAGHLNLLLLPHSLFKSEHNHSLGKW